MALFDFRFDVYPTLTKTGDATHSANTGFTIILFKIYRYIFEK